MAWKLKRKRVKISLTLAKNTSWIFSRLSKALERVHVLIKVKRLRDSVQINTNSVLKLTKKAKVSPLTLVHILSPYVCVSDLFNLQEDLDWPKLIRDHSSYIVISFLYLYNDEWQSSSRTFFKDLGTHISKIVYNYLHSWYSNENTSDIFKTV